MVRPIYDGNNCRLVQREWWSLFLIYNFCWKFFTVSAVIKYFTWILNIPLNYQYQSAHATNILKDYYGSFFFGTWPPTFFDFLDVLGHGVYNAAVKKIKKVDFFRSKPEKLTKKIFAQRSKMTSKQTYIVDFWPLFVGNHGLCLFGKSQIWFRENAKKFEYAKNNNTIVLSMRPPSPKYHNFW